jgi:hypothetical protein
MNIMGSTRNTWLVIAVGAFFVVLAVGGSVLTTRHMNETATVHDSSAGRAGDPQPNTLQDQKSDEAARGSTTGAGRTSSVPPATAGDARQ